jgi:hypothetical protein
LNALLARRDAVRSQKTGPAAEPAADLFQPEHQPTAPLPGADEPGTLTIPEPKPPKEEPTKPEGQAGAGSTTSRLLEAKRRAQKRKDK